MSMKSGCDHCEDQEKEKEDIKEQLNKANKQNSILKQEQIMLKMKIKKLQTKIKNFNASLEELALRQEKVIKNMKTDLSSQLLEAIQKQHMEGELLMPSKEATEKISPRGGVAMNVYQDLLNKSQINKDVEDDLSSIEEGN